MERSAGRVTTRLSLAHALGSRDPTLHEKWLASVATEDPDSKLDSTAHGAYAPVSQEKPKHRERDRVDILET